MKKRKAFSIILIFIILFTFIGLLTACSSFKQNKNQEGEDNLTVRIGYFPNITHSQALIGKAEGTYAKALGESNKVEWKQFNAGPAEIEAMFAGEVDIGYIGPVPAINGYVKSRGDLKIIAGATNGGAILVTRKDLKLTNVNELSGKKVAVPQFGNTQDLSLRTLLSQHGLKDITRGGTVEIQQVSNPDLKLLLDRGDIDAALAPEPWGSILVNGIKANVLLDNDQVWRGGNYSTAVVIVRTEFLKAHPDLVEKFLQAHVELTQFINSNKEAAKEIINSQVHEMTGQLLEKDVLNASFVRLTVSNDPAKDSIIDFANLAIDEGFLKEKTDMSSLIDLSILNKVLLKNK